ncbi:hypothetical protein NXC24_PB00100 (plasmid) [Rhizobium sp. NXC24]|nr:hypothetical protein NXC24_PB00100 [Rhizobium sp. NXC24]
MKDRVNIGAFVAHFLDSTCQNSWLKGEQRLTDDGMKKCRACKVEPSVHDELAITLCHEREPPTSFCDRSLRSMFGIS